MQKNRVTSSIFVLFFLVISSCAFFALAQEKNDTQNIFLDSDQDGLSDAEEKSYGTDPQNSDTDGDGYSDGAEVSGGYDPLKPAPGDKIITTAEKVDEEVLALTPEEENLTKQLEAKIAEAYASADPTTQQLGIDEINKMAEDIMSAGNSVNLLENIPIIDVKDIKIKKQNYSKLPEEEAKAKLKEDATTYLTAMSYIIYSNLPADTDLANLENDFSQMISTAIASQDSQKIEDLAASGEKITAQLKELEVPEDLVDFHLKALQMSQYALLLKNNINPTANDPLRDVQNIYQIRGFMELMTSFLPEMTQKFNTYGISMTDIQKGLTPLGINLPTEQELINSAAAVNNISAE